MFRNKKAYHSIGQPSAAFDSNSRVVWLVLSGTIFSRCFRAFNSMLLLQVSVCVETVEKGRDFILIQGILLEVL